MDWDEVNGALEKTFRCEDFLSAIAFVNRVATAAEAANHHPDIAISYKDVTFRWRTHSEDAITDLDRQLAAETDSLFQG